MFDQIWGKEHQHNDNLEEIETSCLRRASLSLCGSLVLPRLLGGCDNNKKLENPVVSLPIFGSCIPFMS